MAERPLYHIGGTLAIEVPMWFELAPDPNENRFYIPTLFISAKDPTCSLNTTTRSAVDGLLGSGMADRISLALSAALKDLLSVASKAQLFAIGFKIVPGIESRSPSQLSALPTVAWINDLTLGVFGYYRASANGGDITLKKDGDLVQTQEEYFYGLAGVDNILPGRRCAVLLSAEAF